MEKDKDTTKAKKITGFANYQWIVDKDETTKVLPANENTPQKMLIIDNQSFMMQECSCSYSSSQLKVGTKIYGVLGIIKIFPVAYLFVITGQKLVCELNIGEKLKIYEVTDTQLIVINNEGSAEHKEFESQINKIMKCGFYYVQGHDLTKKFTPAVEQTQDDSWIKDQLKLSNEEFECNKQEFTEDRYWWNKRLYEHFEYCDIPDSPWRIKLIRGNVVQDEIFLGTGLMTVTLITRKATLMNGILDTGLDDDGSVANFMETEQIFEYEGNIFSFYMLRGSVPCFWDKMEDKIDDLTQPYAIEIQREFEIQDTAFKLHLYDLLKSYSKVVMVNLLDNSNNYELALLKLFEFLLMRHKDKLRKCLKYQFCNFKKTLMNKEIEDISKLKTSADVMKFYWRNSKGVVNSTQKAVLKFNSLNCLHRANKCQQKFSYYILKQIIYALDAKKLINKDKLKWAYLAEKTESLYKSNGARLCLESGCSCIINIKKSEEKGYFALIKNQVSSIGGMFTSYLPSGQEKDVYNYQETLDYIRGINKKNCELFENSIQSKLHEEESKYSKANVYRFGFITWNLGGNEFTDQLDFENTMKSCKDSFNDPPDFYVAGFQETRKLNAMALIQGASKVKNVHLQTLVKTALEKNAQKKDKSVKYLCFADVALCGKLLLIFCKTSLKSKISKLSTTRIKQGIAGKIGNKGATIVRFNLDNSSIAIVCAHLESGQKRVNDRVTQFKSIVNEGIIGKKHKMQYYYAHDVKLFLGDLNFRIDMDYEFAKVASINFREDDMMILNQNDQLNKIRKEDPEMSDVMEGELDFKPTYKYDKQKDVYDTSKKQRVPAWCDRILWFKNPKQVQQLAYERKENMFSDHRPVIAYMNITTYQHDNEKLNEIKEKIIESKKQEVFLHNKETFMEFTQQRPDKRKGSFHDTEMTRDELISQREKQLAEKRISVMVEPQAQLTYEINNLFGTIEEESIRANPSEVESKQENAEQILLNSSDDMREVQLEDEPLELEDGNDSPVDYEKGMADY